ncbi:hypothetical protein BH09VER1_BH09VER1_18970 [soil metagenome]
MFRYLTALLLLTCLASAKAGWKELGALPGRALAWEYETKIDDRPVRVTGVSFPATSATFRVIDNPPTNRKNLADALAVDGAIAGTNGGYFHPDFTPLGLVVSAGRTLHAQEKARLLSGLLVIRGGKIQLVRAEGFKPGPDIQEALQAGPWLVENGIPVAGLNAERAARRTLISSNGKGSWALITISPITLADTAGLLLRKEFLDHWSTLNALNLDGGSSTSLFASSPGAPLADIPSFGPVANYLAIVPRSK